MRRDGRTEVVVRRGRGARAARRSSSWRRFARPSTRCRSFPATRTSSVNVSPSTLARRALDAAGARRRPGRLVVEVTEHAADRRLHEARPRARAAPEAGSPARDRRHGRRLREPDAHLLRLGPDVIKIDRTLDPGDRPRPLDAGARLRHLGFANQSGASIVAEGVERRAPADDARRARRRARAGLRLRACRPAAPAAAEDSPQDPHAVLSPNAGSTRGRSRRAARRARSRPRPSCGSPSSPRP